MKAKTRKVFRWVAAGAGIALLMPLSLFALVYFGAFGRLYSGEELKNIQNYLATEVHSSDGHLLGSYFWQNRSKTDKQHIPHYLTEALIATEDARFYEHNGVDFRSLLRVFFKTLLLRDKSAGGGSTISQQLAKNLFKRESHGMLTMPVNKIKEAIHAVRFSSVYSQEEVLLLYLNTVSVGEDTYGIKNAATRFFNKPPDSLTVEEAAVLVGMLKSPTSYNPRLHPGNALARRNVVIDNMALHSYISRGAADSLKRVPLILHYKNSGLYGDIAPYFLQHIEELGRSILDTLQNEEGKKYNLYTDGLKIYTTLDYRMQEYAQSAIQSHMASLQKLFDRQWVKNKVLLNSIFKNSPVYKRLKKEKATPKQISKAFNTASDMDVFDWQGTRSVRFTYADSVQYYLKLLHTGFLAMEPASGAVKVWIGGDNYRFFQYDHIKAQRQVGSTFKPIVYATALEQGMSPCDYIDNDRRVYAQFGSWSPENADGVYGGKYSLKGALSNSVNVISVEVLLRAGIKNSIATARRMGITSPLPQVPALALGVANISLLEMVKAYCVFPNGGNTVEPVLITKIEDSHGKVIYSNRKYTGKRALSRQTAFFMTEMLKGVINEGTGARIRSKYGLKEDFAGKTGTTQSSADGWFIGYTPTLVAGAWVGADNPAIHFRSSEYGQGAAMALPIWAMFMQKNEKDKQRSHYLTGKFGVPAGLMPMPECESFRKDNLFDRIGDLFRKKGNRVRPPGEKEKKWFQFWKK